MKVTVDRFEGEIAVLLVRPDELHRILIPRELLPDVEEGEILEITVIREGRETEETRKRITSLIEQLRQQGD